MKGGNHGIIGGKPYISGKKGDNQWGEIQLRENQRTPFNNGVDSYLSELSP